MTTTPRLGNSISNAQFYNNTIYLTPYNNLAIAGIRIISVGAHGSQLFTQPRDFRARIAELLSRIHRIAFG